MVDKAQYFRSLEDRYGLPEGYLSRTETIESQGNVRAYNKNSGAAGPFQFVPKSQKEFNLKDPYSLEESAEAAARMAARNKVSLQRQGIENPTAADLYAAHQQGAKGYVDLLRAGDQPASKVVGEDAVVWNGGKPNMSASEFANKITNKFSGDSSSQPRTFTPPSAGVLEKPKVDVADTPEQAAALENQQSALSTEDALTAMQPRRDTGNGLKELGFLHNYFKSLDTSATGVKPLAMPDFFHQPKYKEGGIVSLKKDAEKVRAAGIGGDTVLAHITASEAALLKSMGGSGRINPRTGLPMFEDGDGGSPGDPGDNQGSSVGEPSTDSPDNSPGDPGYSDGYSPGDPDAPSPNAVEAAFQGGIPGLSFGSSLSSALGPTSMGSFGLSGVTSNTAAPGTSTPFGGAPTDPGVTPGYDGFGANVASTAFGGSLAPDVNSLGPDRSSANSPFADATVDAINYGSTSNKFGPGSQITAQISSEVPQTPQTPQTQAPPTTEPVVTPSEPVVTPSEPVVNPPDPNVQVAETEAETQALENALGMIGGPVSEGPSTGDMGNSGGGGNDGGSDSSANTVVPITTADVVTTPVTPVATAPSPVKYDVSKFLSNLGKPTYTPTPSVYTSYPRVTVPQYSQPVTQLGIGQFYKPYFPLLPYQRRYP